MDFGTALSQLIKPQPQFPSLNDPTTLLALANLKYPIGNFNFSNYANSLMAPRQQTSNGIPNFDLASIIAAATASVTAAQDHSSKLSISSLTTNVSMPSSDQLRPSTINTPTPSLNSSNATLSQLPIPIPTQPTSPTQSSASASSISSVGSSSLIQSAQSSPSRQNGASTPLFGSGYKRKLNGTPSRKPPKPIPDENKDASYYERRKKNNDAAKRSRDARKMKEEHTAARASFLESENIQLRTQIELMKGEISKLQVMLLTKSSTTSDYSMSATVKDEIDSNHSSS